MKEALEENKRECLQQKQDILDNVTAIVEALKADYEYKLSTVKRQPQPQSCTDGKILGLQPLIGLSNGQLAVCDSVIDSYGWIVIQRRTSADVDFFRGWEDYKNGFGDLSGNFWFGLEKVHQLTSRGRYELRIDMTYKGKYYYARYESFLLYGEAKQYKIEISGFSGNVVDKMAYHNGQAFSTKDRDNDPSDGSCAEKWHGAWWYKTCHHVNLNGVWGSTEFAKGVNWKSVTGWEDSVSFSEMKIRPLSH
ncbi:ficolin-1 [Aplysia californica]|uniref:Ficolin-1 n=1 Tax=Aplysia californica TaxID=6500 RepID=A0ABM1A3Q5_APLCA|nr:ficolin-1 [Aplysia californica]